MMLGRACEEVGGGEIACPDELGLSFGLGLVLGDALEPDEGAGVAPRSGRLSAFAALHSPRLQRKECRHWAKGDCKHGEACRFLHAQTPSEASQALTEPHSPKEEAEPSLSPEHTQPGAAAEEKRRDTDGKLYTRADFVRQYGGDEQHARASPGSVQGSR